MGAEAGGRAGGLRAARERGRAARPDEAVVRAIAARIQNQGQAVCDIDDARALLSQFYASQAEVARLREALLLARPALVSYDGLRTVSCQICDRDLPARGVGDCPHGDRCPVAVTDRLGEVRDGG